MLKLKLQYFGHLMPKADSLEKDPDAGKDEGQEKGATEYEMVGQNHQLNEHKFAQTVGRTGKPGVLQSMGSHRVGHDLAT